MTAHGMRHVCSVISYLEHDLLTRFAHVVDAQKRFGSFESAHAEAAHFSVRRHNDVRRTLINHCLTGR